MSTVLLCKNSKKYSNKQLQYAFSAKLSKVNEKRLEITIVVFFTISLLLFLCIFMPLLVFLFISFTFYGIHLHKTKVRFFRNKNEKRGRKNRQKNTEQQNRCIKLVYFTIFGLKTHFFVKKEHKGYCPVEGYQIPQYKSDTQNLVQSTVIFRIYPDCAQKHL